MPGRRNGGDRRLKAISLHPGRSGGTSPSPNLPRRRIGEPLKPFLFTQVVAVDPQMPFKAKQSLVKDDVVRGFGVTPSDVEVLSTRNIVLDDQDGQFGYIIGNAKFDIDRHNDSGRPQLLYLFGIAPDNVVLFFGQFRPLNITLPCLNRDEARQIRGLLRSTDSKDLVCTAIELVEDGGDDLQTQNILRVTSSEMLGGGLFLPMSPAA